MQPRQQRFVDLQKSQQFVRPSAVDDVEQERAAGIADFRRILAGHAVADVILRQQDVLGPGVDFWLILANPENLWRGESRERGIRNKLDQRSASAGFGFDLCALRCRALIISQQGGAKGLGSVAEKDAAVHLPG